MTTSSDAPMAPTGSRRARRQWLRRLVWGSAIATPVAILALWIAVNRVEWLGPYVADGLRSVVGVEAVARLEDFAYGIQDRVNRVLRRGEAPKAYWDVTQPVKTQEPPPAAPSGSPAQRDAQTESRGRIAAGRFSLRPGASGC